MPGLPFLGKLLAALHLEGRGLHCRQAFQLIARQWEESIQLSRENAVKLRRGHEVSRWTEIAANASAAAGMYLLSAFQTYHGPPGQSAKIKNLDVFGSLVLPDERCGEKLALSRCNSVNSGPLQKSRRESRQSAHK